MPPTRSIVYLASIALVTTALAGCVTEAPATSTPAHEATFTASEYSFDGPTTLPAGLTKITLINEGQEPHHIQLVRLDEGHTVEEFGQALSSGALPSWATEVGGPNTGTPGIAPETSAYVDLEPGTYVVMCVIPDAEGTPHVAHGMLDGITVEDHEHDHGPPPAPTVDAELADFRFEMPDTLPAGEHTFRVSNDGAQPHELVLIQLMGNATPEDFLAWAKDPANATGPPPAKMVGGITGIESGMAQSFNATLEPGRYAVLCFLPDIHGDHAPHVTKGMIDEFTVS